MRSEVRKRLLRRWARLILEDVEGGGFRDEPVTLALLTAALITEREIRELAIVEAEKLDARGRG